MSEALFLAYQNLGDYLSLSSWFPCFTLKKLLLQLRESSDKKRKQYDNQTSSCFEYSSSSGWQRVHEDIMEMIVRRLSLRDRIRTGLACKSWNSVCMRGHIRGAQEAPWLVLPQDPNCKYMSVTNLADGKVHKLRLPKRIHGSRFYGSSRGWLIMIQEKRLNSKMFLFNPVSGALCQLPPLATIPSFKEFVETEWDLCGTSFFFNHIVLSTSDINNSECMVAAIFDNLQVLVMCRPGDKTWSGFQVLDENEHHCQLLFSSTGKLYSLAISYIKSELIQPRTIKFGDVEVELILVYDNADWIVSDIEYHNDYKISLNGEYESFLFESTNNEVLVIHQTKDEGDTDYDDYQYFRTAGFEVYKIDPETGDFLKEQSLGDQTLFLSSHGSFSLRASDFIELDRNNIYFATNGIDPFNVHKPFTTREIGIFCLDNERVERSFPSVQESMGSRMSWFTPSL
ncbi:putative F-box protein At1g65770 [Prunus persica]|uniref:putative F-box protein At1g65770 n=1 Tax=Prunus persica TaxID=3760 RepID=UPI0009AB5528|nr:putative F-box protein At1g65770 [Prunus persica]